MEEKVFWTADYARPAGLGQDALPARADVVVVGSGYTGLNAALALRSAGASVVVVDQRQIGWGASSRNGGMATSGLKMEMPAVFKKYGQERGKAFWDWAQRAIDHVAETVSSEGIDCDFVRSGHALLAVKPAHFRRMFEEAEWFARELNHDQMQVVSASNLAEEIGSRAYFGALVDETSAALHPAKYVFGLAQAATRKGALLIEEAPVVKLQRKHGRQGGAWQVTTCKGVVEADEVLLATNGYTTGLSRSAREGIFPAGSYIIATEPLPVELQRELSPRGRMFFDTRHFLNYFRLTPDGRMLFGGRHNLSTSLDALESALLLRERMVAIFPQLAEYSVAYTWTGKLGLTFDLMPHIGRTAADSSGDGGGLWYAYGYAGHGVAMASRMGFEVGEMIAGMRETNLFREIGHAKFPFTPLDRWYLPLVSGWFRLLDRAS